MDSESGVDILRLFSWMVDRNDTPQSLYFTFYESCHLKLFTINTNVYDNKTLVKEQGGVHFYC